MSDFYVTANHKTELVVFSNSAGHPVLEGEQPPVLGGGQFSVRVGKKKRVQGDGVGPFYAAAAESFLQYILVHK